MTLTDAALSRLLEIERGLESGELFYSHVKEEYEALKQQISGWREAAQNWHEFVTATAKTFDIEEIVWKGGRYDFEQWFKNLKENKQLRQRLDAKISELQKELTESPTAEQNHLFSPSAVKFYLEQIRGECKHYDREELNCIPNPIQIRCKDCGKILEESK